MNFFNVPARQRCTLRFGMTQTISQAVTDDTNTRTTRHPIRQRTHGDDAVQKGPLAGMSERALWTFPTENNRQKWKEVERGISLETSTKQFPCRWQAAGLSFVKLLIFACLSTRLLVHTYDAWGLCQIESVVQNYCYTAKKKKTWFSIGTRSGSRKNFLLREFL